MSEAVSVGGVTGVAQVFVSVSDVDRSLAFYRDVLGLHEWMRMAGQPMAFLYAGDVRIYLDGHPTEPGFASSVVYYRVDDLPAETERLRAAGVPVTSEPHELFSTAEWTLWLAFFTDPDGTPFGLMAEVPR